MANLDELEAGYLGSGAVSTPMESPAPISPLDALEAGYLQSSPVTAAPSQHSELRAVGNSAVKSLGALVSLFEEVLPIELNPSKVVSENSVWKVPHLFGLGPARGKGEIPFQDQFLEVAKERGLLTDDKPQTEIGKLADNVAENAVSAAPFGPQAMIAAGILGGLGGYAGEKVGDAVGAPGAGRIAGSFLGGASPAAISKIGIVKEIVEQLGPTLSQLPLMRAIFGDAPLEAAVGRALSKQAEDLPKAEAALREAAETIGPQTQLDSLKTTAEIAGDRGLARAEDATSNMLADAPFKSLDAERAAAREASVMGGYDPKQTGYETSKALEQKVLDSAKNIEAVEDATWAALPKDTPISTEIPGALETLQKSLDDITYSGALPIEGEGAGLLKKLNKATSEGAVSLGVIQEIRSDALRVSRATKNATNASDRVTHKVANTLEEHLRNLVDSNVAQGLASEDVAKIWEGGRAITKRKINTFAAPKAGTENAGTKSLEQLALKGGSLDNTTLLREGLNSPDKLQAHIQAGLAGGEDVTPLYQQALKSELDGAPQSQWRDIIDRKREQWEMVFPKKAIENLDRNLADVEAQLNKGRLASTTGSQTNPRGNVQKAINAEKGIAGLNLLTQSGSLAGAAAGATTGWNKSETTAGGIANALLYGATGALLGKAASSSAVRASDRFDDLLTEALRNPRKGLSAIEAAKPSKFSETAQQLFTQSATSSLAKEGARQVTPSRAPSEDSQKKDFTDIFTKKEIDMIEDGNPNKVILEKQIDADPYLSALYSTESARGKYVTNSESSAKGPFQFIDATAKAIGLKDPFDLGQSLEAVQKLTAENKRILETDDPEQLYAAHFLGPGTVLKVREGRPLSAQEKKNVEAFMAKALPNFRKHYAKTLERSAIV